MFKVKGYVDCNLVLEKLLEHLPRVGDILRFSSTFGKVYQIVWCMDEHTFEGQRVDLWMKSIENMDEG